MGGRQSLPTDGTVDRVARDVAKMEIGDTSRRTGRLSMPAPAPSSSASSASLPYAIHASRAGPAAPASSERPTSESSTRRPPPSSSSDMPHLAEACTANRPIDMRRALRGALQHGGEARSVGNIEDAFSLAVDRRTQMGGYNRGHFAPRRRNEEPVKCPVCVETFTDPTQLSEHLVGCLPRAVTGYNEDVLVADIHHECQICFEDMVAGETTARLPCLCLYHKDCIECWFIRSRTCPQHPG